MYSRKEVEDNTILLALTGSRSYNLHNTYSDYDYRGIMVQDRNRYLSLSNFEQKDKGFTTEPFSKFSMLSKDTVIYRNVKYT